jgi:predicted CopG family antitoxin
MAVKTISLSEEAYAKLEAERAEGESFESVIERLTRKRSLRDIVGFLKETDAAELERIIEALRARSRERTLKLLEELKER